MDTLDVRRALRQCPIVGPVSFPDGRYCYVWSQWYATVDDDGIAYDDGLTSYGPANDDGLTHDDAATTYDDAVARYDATTNDDVATHDGVAARYDGLITTRNDGLITTRNDDGLAKHDGLTIAATTTLILP